MTSALDCLHKHDSLFACDASLGSHSLTGVTCAVHTQIMGSEVGVVDVPHSDIASKGRLMPGNIFLVDFQAGRVIKDEEARPSPA